MNPGSPLMVTSYLAMDEVDWPQFMLTWRVWVHWLKPATLGLALA